MRAMIVTVQCSARRLSLGIWICFGIAACGNASRSEDGIDLVGTPAPERRPPVSSHVNASQFHDFVGVDLIQDLLFRKRRDGWTLSTPDAHVNLDKLKTAGLRLVFSAIPPVSGPISERRFLKTLDEMDAMSAETDGFVRVAARFDEAERIIKDGRIAFMYMIESPDVFINNPVLLKKARDRGLLMVGLTGTRSNAFADSALAPRELSGLTEKGRAFLKNCKDLNLTVDLTCASRQTFWAVLEASAGSAVVSHSAARTLMEHPRNLDDVQILGLKRYGGILGILLNPEYLVMSGDASIDDVIAHIMHIKALGALDILSLGTDFGGIKPPRGLPDIAALPVLRDALIRQGVSEQEIRGVFGDNALGFFRKASAPFGAEARTTEEILIPADVECNFVSGISEGRLEAACNGYVRDVGPTIPPSTRLRLRLRDMTVFPVTLEIFGEPGGLWQVEAQNLVGKILFHRIVQLDAEGNGVLPLPSDRNLTRLFLSPTRNSMLKEAVIWGRSPLRSL